MRNRVAAIVLTFFTGFLGLHKFYLGKNFAGVMYLIFSATGIPFILAFFDFLGLAFMSDEAFDRKFNGASATPIFPINSRKESSREIAATLGELKKLYDNGVITAEEYEVKRRKLLDSI